ncbi:MULTISPECIES: hypothetical protein [Streptomyces]|jgi:seryl-tRNA synthetase|uniref:Aminoacyl-transfer RNA synthetases class-II family profile domain-containing protein n=1 Tax=Streptomyces sp. 900129855 TaxID=3155129 RepID=A0ABV2ZLK9_9ACTN
MADDMPSSAFLTALVKSGHLLPLGADGVYGHGSAFEAIVEGVQHAITERGADQRATSMRLPPVYPAANFARTGYPVSFPHLGGAVFTFRDAERRRRSASADVGDEAAQDEWTASLVPSGLVLVPAACQPVYALQRGDLPERGRVLDVLAQCFRREPSRDPFRMQTFRQREYVYLGDAAGARTHLDTWRARGVDLLRELGLAASPLAASDPFFGRAGRLLAANQLDAGAKTELTVPLHDTGTDGQRTSWAVASCNYHGDHFGLSFGISSGGAPAHTACVGFGLERLTLALLGTHGMDPVRWPVSVRKALLL